MGDLVEGRSFVGNYTAIGVAFEGLELVSQVGSGGKHTRATRA